MSNTVTLSGCTNDDFRIPYTGYLADVDNGSCSTTIYSLNLTPELFNPITQTDNSMIVGMNVPSINLFKVEC